jgi:D-threo-aldose 1-dehydrogenase
VLDPAERVPLGRTSLTVTRLGLGCAALGNLYDAVDDGEARATADAAWAAGLRLFGTAPLYGHGLSERRIGAALRARPRAAYVLATKVGRRLVPGRDPSTIFADAPPLVPGEPWSLRVAFRLLFTWELFQIVRGVFRIQRS